MIIRSSNSSAELPEGGAPATPRLFGFRGAHPSRNSTRPPEGVIDPGGAIGLQLAVRHVCRSPTAYGCAAGFSPKSDPADCKMLSPACTRARGVERVDGPCQIEN